jgi:hypothetical protein
MTNILARSAIVVSLSAQVVLGADREHERADVVAMGSVGLGIATQRAVPKRHVRPDAMLGGEVSVADPAASLGMDYLIHLNLLLGVLARIAEALHCCASRRNT